MSKRKLRNVCLRREILDFFQKWGMLSCKARKRKNQSEFLKFLQQGPTLSEEEIKNIETVG
jgi:hypothetical protein